MQIVPVGDNALYAERLAAMRCPKCHAGVDFKFFIYGKENT